MTHTSAYSARSHTPLARLVRPAAPTPWIPPPALVPYEDPHLMARVLAALRQL